MEPVQSVLSFQSNSLNSFPRMWYHIFLWALFSSIMVHTVAALIAFLTLRKHKFGKFFPITILCMGILTPTLTGIITSAAIAFVYRALGYVMNPIYAMFWGCGQTFIMGCMGFTRILATL